MKCNIYFWKFDIIDSVLTIPFSVFFIDVFICMWMDIKYFISKASLVYEQEHEKWEHILECRSNIKTKCERKKKIFSSSILFYPQQELHISPIYFHLLTIFQTIETKSYVYIILYHFYFISFMRNLLNAIVKFASSVVIVKIFWSSGCFSKFRRVRLCLIYLFKKF